MKNKFSENKGITLISLIITILVMLILASVSISMIVGENGVIVRSEEAKKKMKIAEIIEKANLLGSALITQKKANNNPSLANVVTFRDELLKEFNVGSVDTNEDTIIELDDKYAIIIKNTKLEVEVIEKKSPYYITIDEAQDIWKTDGEGRIEEYIGTDSNVIVPIKIGEEYIIGLGEKVFKDCTFLTDIKICGNIKRMSITGDNTTVNSGDGLFVNCTNLKNVTIYDGVTSIGATAFKNCTSLTSITIPSSVKYTASFSEETDNSVSWGGNLFKGCTNLKTIYLEAEEYSPEKNYAFDDAPWGAPNAQVIDLNKTQN